MGSYIVVSTQQQRTTEEEAWSILGRSRSGLRNGLFRARDRPDSELCTYIGREAIRTTEVMFETET